VEKHVIPVIGKKRLDALTGADDKELQRRAFAAGLRHANTGITARTYSHMLDEQVGVAGAAMTRAFGAK
jgi:hypothetical protein